MLRTALAESGFFLCMMPYDCSFQYLYIFIFDFS